MTNIWDEKPGYNDQEYDCAFYEREEMDAWLEKLKSHYTRTPSNLYVQALGELARERGKLEAIKTWFKKHRWHIDEEYGDEHAKARMKLQEILGVEG